MSLTNEQIKNIVNKLHDSNDGVVLETINEIRKIGDDRLIGSLLNVMKNNKNPEVSNLIINLLNDLKIQSSVPEIIKCIKDKTCDNNITQVTASCWQNGLNFSEHLDTFVNILIAYDYQTAIEAFTVIEENLENATHQQIDELRDNIKSKMIQASEDKQLLLGELLKMI